MTPDEFSSSGNKSADALQAQGPSAIIPDIFDSFSDESTDALKVDVPLTRDSVPETTGKKKAETREAEAHAQESVDRNKLRKPLFWVIIGLLNVSYASTTFMMWEYLSHVSFVPDRGIMIAWISAAIAQLVGLTLIIARYLFPADRR